MYSLDQFVRRREGDRAVVVQVLFPASGSSVVVVPRGVVPISVGANKAINVKLLKCGLHSQPLRTGLYTPMFIIRSLKLTTKQYKIIYNPM